MLRAAEQSGPRRSRRWSAFLRVAETGSFTAAAERLGLPKSTVSRRVARLEEKLGVQLLHRTTRSLALTEAGNVFHERAARALAGLEEATQAVRETQRDAARAPAGDGAVRPRPRRSGRWWPSFTGTFPEVTVELLLTDRTLDLVAEGIDLALRGAAALPDSSLVGRKLASLEFCAGREPGVPEAAGDPAHAGRAGRARPRADADDAAGAASCRCTPRTARARSCGARGGQRQRLRGSCARRRWRTGTSRCCRTSYAGPEVRAGRLVRVLPGYTVGTGNMFLVHPAARVLPAKARAFRDFLLEHIEVLTAGHAPPSPMARAQVRCAVKKRRAQKAGVSGGRRS
jgi:DNA-binding transcriptional LysR family regulator